MRKAFTLVEIMIAVVIIAVLVGIAIPNLLRARLSANEQHAISNLQTVSAASQTYLSVKNSLPDTLSDLYGEGYVPDNTLACASQPCLKSGYNFVVGGTGLVSDFFVYAVPQTPNMTGVRSFCTDSDGVVRVNPAGTAPAGRQACAGWNPL